MKVKVGDLKVDEIKRLAEKYGASEYALKRVGGETYLILREPYTYRNINLKNEVFKEFKQKKKEYMEKARISKLTDSDFLSMLLVGDLK